MGSLKGELDKLRILHEVALDIEMRVLVENGRVNILFAQLDRGAEVGAHGALGVRANQRDARAGVLIRILKQRLNTIGLQVGAIPLAQLIGTYFAYEPGLNAEISKSVDSVCSAAARGDARIEVFNRLDNFSGAFIVNKLHAALREIKVSEDIVIRHADKDIHKGVAHAEDFSFHYIFL